jgi:hypothetical protein
MRHTRPHLFRCSACLAETFAPRVFALTAVRVKKLPPPLSKSQQHHLLFKCTEELLRKPRINLLIVLNHHLHLLKNRITIFLRLIQKLPQF